MSPKPIETENSTAPLGEGPGADVSAAVELLTSGHAGPDEVRAALGGMETRDAAAVLAQVAEDQARSALRWVPKEQAAAVLGEADPAWAAGLIARMPSDERADVLSVMDPDRRGAIQSHLPAQAAGDAARLLTYAPDVAGGLMETEYLSFPAATTVRDAIRHLRANQEKYAVIGVQYLYVLDEAGRLVGVAPIRDLLLAPEDATLVSLAKGAPVTVLDTAPLHDIAAIFDEHPFVALPVVDANGVMLGVVTRADANQGEQEEAEDDYRVSQGIVGGEELRSMPLTVRARRRGVWLAVNLVLCLGGAAVIALHQDTLAQALIVAAVLPVISATSGNAAMQAAAVSIRELTLGIASPGSWKRVISREAWLALLLAIPLGAGVAALAAMSGGGWGVGVPVGLAMAANTCVAVCIGALCPLVLRRLNVDPALASGPISTTIADVTGFTLTLWFVAMMT
jgi:magnesium transporter